MVQLITYYLLWHPGTNRLVIDKDSSLHGYKVEKKVAAHSWIEAKKKLGFELTPLQQRMLDEKNNRAEAGRRLVRHIKDAGKELRVTDSELQDGGEVSEDSGIDLQQVLCQ